MKITARDIQNFLQRPNPVARVILVYGPDTGLVKERAKILGQTVVSDLSDPFNVAQMTADQIKDDPARLSDEAHAISMMGGGRLIRVTDAADKLTTALKAYLESASEDSLVVVEGGDLPARSSLRKLCEGASNAAALPCYVEDERDLSRVIRDTMQSEGLSIDGDAVGWLATNIQGDRGRARSELEKLVIYKFSDEDKRVTLDDVMNICGVSGASSMDDLVHATALGQADKAFAAYQKLTEEGLPVIAILRGLQNHFLKLYQARDAMDGGASADQAMKSCSPPIFFKYQPHFRSQLQKWRARSLPLVLRRLMDVEADCKKTGTPIDALCRQTILGISKMRS